MKKHEEKKTNRRWVVRAMIAFVVILALLTFFSNTIMNMTIPLVMASNAQRGNLAYTNNATAQITADGEVKVNGIQDRVVDQVLHTNYDLVQEGDVILTLQPVEDTSSLTDLETQLRTAQRNLEYAYRTPNHAPTYTTERAAIRTAEQQLAAAQATLNSATTASDTIYNAQQILNTNQTALAALTPQIAAATATVESINAQIALVQSQINMIDAGTPVYETQRAMNAPAPAAPAKNDPATDSGDPATPATPDSSGTGAGSTAADPNAASAGDPAASSSATTTTAQASETSTTTAASSESSTEASTETSATPTPTAAPTAAPAPTNVPVANVDRATLVNRLTQLQGQLAIEQARLDALSAQSAAATTAITAAQEAITQAQGLPSTYAAEDAVADAQAALEAAQIALSDAQINAGINADKNNDTIEDYIMQIASLEDKIAKKRAQLECVEIVAPCDGYVFNMGAATGDKLVENVMVFSIVPEQTTYSATFIFPTNAVQGMNVGDTLTCNNYFVQSVTITNIKPDPNNPRNNRQVKCAVTSNDGTMWPGESITVTADKSNQTYDHVIAASAVSEDNSGTYVYVIDKTTSPLGDRYVVRRVSVTVQARAGSLVAISGQGIDNVTDLMIVTRSEEPLHNGDRVRLEDYSDSQNR